MPTIARFSHPLLAGLSVLGVALALAVPPAAAQTDVAGGLHAGTSGVGPEVSFRLSERSHLRLTGGFATYGTEISTDDIDYDADIDLATGLVLLDWHPTGGAFRVSVGGGWNGTEAEVSAPIERLLADHIPRDGLGLLAPLGSVRGTAAGDDFVPAALLGWGNPFRGGRWNVSFEIGALYQGEPEVELALRPSFPLDDLPFEIPPGLVDAALAAQEAELERELEDYTVLPVVRLGVSYRF